jgi:hypothetical protein
LRGRFGQAAIPFQDSGDENIDASDGSSSLGFPQENFRILHSYSEGGVVSMMKELKDGGGGGGGSGGKKTFLQDSRFFVTFSPNAAWADGRYVAFGRVVRGLKVLKDLETAEVQPPANYPLRPVRIVGSGCYPSPSPSPSPSPTPSMME